MDKNKSSPLVEDFRRYFDLDLATTAQQLESVFAMRYRVYCEEFAYEPADAFPDKLESDEFDANSSHCIVRHKATDSAAGCARIVHTDEHTQLPMEKFCSQAIDQKFLRSFDGRRDSICEFSRLGVDSAFRRRPGEGQSRFGEVAAIDCSKREERTFSMIAVATILSGLAMSELDGRPHCFAMMEAFLPRLLKRSGLIVHPVGTEIEYHGSRTPYYFETETLVAGAADELQGFYSVIRDGFASGGTLSSGSVKPAANTGREQASALSFLDPFFSPVLGT